MDVGSSVVVGRGDIATAVEVQEVGMGATALVRRT